MILVVIDARCSSKLLNTFANNWLAVKEFQFSYQNSKTIAFAIYP